MVAREAPLDPKADWSTVHPDAIALTYYVLSPELRDMRCPAAAFSQAHGCSGNGGVPCLKGHLELLHPQATHQVQVMLDLCQRVLGPELEGPPFLRGALHYGAGSPDYTDTIPAGLIRGFIAQLT